MPAVGVVMRPMHDGRSAGVVNHFAAHDDLVAGLNGNPWSNVHVVDNFQRTGGRADVEGFVLALRAAAEKVSRVRGHIRGKVTSAGRVPE